MRTLSVNKKLESLHWKMKEDRKIIQHTTALKIARQSQNMKDLRQLGAQWLSQNMDNK